MSDTDMTLWERPTATDVDFAALMKDADYVQGRDLLDKPVLVGQPFIITHLRFNPGKGKDFVSIEATTKDGREVVFNDGSTGVRRQMVAYLTGKGLVDPGKGSESGAEDCRYDTVAAQWVKGSDVAEEGFDVRLVATRGLRESTYDYQGDTVSTFYLA